MIKPHVGSPVIFSLEKVETTNGCEIPGSIVALGTNAIFSISQNGFFMFDGNRSVPIGAEKIDNWFYENLNSAFTNRVTSAIDPNNQLVVWSFPSNSSSDGTADTMLVYNYAVNRWSIVELTHQSIGTILLPGYTLEELDTINTNIDAMTTSFDSPIYAGESFSLAASKDNKLHSFTGDILGATNYLIGSVAEAESELRKSVSVESQKLFSLSRALDEAEANLVDLLPEVPASIIESLNDELSAAETDEQDMVGGLGKVLRHE